MATVADAQHEAAHIVVGVAVGLHLVRASLAAAWGELEGPDGSEPWAGYTWFRPGAPQAEQLMLAAGIAWERRVTKDLAGAAGDAAALRALGVTTSGGTKALERAAWALLEGRAGVHARVTRALLNGDLTQADLKRFARIAS